MASRTYAAGFFCNSCKCIPAGWNWIAAKHEVLLPPALGSEALRFPDTPEQSDPHLALEDVRRDRSLPTPPFPASSGWSSISKAPRMPPSTHSAWEPRGPSQIAPSRTAFPLVKKKLVGWRLGDFAQRSVELDKKDPKCAVVFFRSEMILGHGDHAALYHLCGYASAGLVTTPPM